MIFHNQLKHQTLHNDGENVNVDIELGQDEDKYLEEGQRFQSGDDWILPPGEDLAQLQAHVYYGGGEEEEIVELLDICSIVVQQVGKVNGFFWRIIFLDNFSEIFL